MRRPQLTVALGIAGVLPERYAEANLIQANGFAAFRRRRVCGTDRMQGELWDKLGSRAGMQVQEQVGREPVGDCCPEPDSLFERCGWFYALCREHLFHDHSEEIGRQLWDGAPEAGTHMIELGCGPGFYACRFAEKYPEMRTTGIDLSRNLLTRARTRAAQMKLTNAEFHLADVHALPATVGEVDVIVISRLFLVVPNRDAVMREVYRVLRPGGKCFVAEPVSSARTQFPLSAMWLLAKLTSFAKVPYVEPHRVTTMSEEEFRALVYSQPWSDVHLERTGRYQHAVCTKPVEAAVGPIGALSEERAVA